MKIESQIKKISQNPGVYIFKDKSGQILYIGKATNLKSRVSSYFNNSKKENRPVMSALERIVKIETRESDSVLEALILEANLIKKYQPKFNVELKDDKSFSYIVFTKEDFPRVLIVRETELEKTVSGKTFGPYVSKKQLETALKIIRKIFPFHSRKEKSEKGCLEFQLGLCPGPYAGAISKNDYRKNIQNIALILSGKKKRLLQKLRKEMVEFSKKQEFEKATERRNKIFALEHIRDVALISDEINQEKLKAIRIEAYDISNISGVQATGSMVVFDNSERRIDSNKKEYRKFKIKSFFEANDVGMMAEVLRRRFRNNWPKPNLILLDGGKGHLNMAEKIFEKLRIRISLVAVAKGPTRKISDFQFIFSEKFPISNEQKALFRNKNTVGKIMEEAHRFAIGYHRQLRSKNFLG